MEQAKRSLHRIKTVLFFLLVWMIVVYALGGLIEFLEESTITLLGALAGALVAVVKWFSWKRGLTAEERTPKGYFWLYLPWAVSVVLPLAFIAVRAVWFAPPEPEQTAWGAIREWAPLATKLVVPACALLVVYWMIGRVEKKIG